MQRVTNFKVALMQRDMLEKGFEPVDLTDRIRRKNPKFAHSTLLRFLGEKFQTLKTLKLIAKALGHPHERYLPDPVPVADTNPDAATHQPEGIPQ